MRHLILALLLATVPVQATNIYLSSDTTWTSTGSSTYVDYIGGNGHDLKLAGAGSFSFGAMLNGIGTLEVAGSGNRTFTDYVGSNILLGSGTGHSIYSGHVNNNSIRINAGTHDFSGIVNTGSLKVYGGNITLSGTGDKHIANTDVFGGTLFMNQSGGAAINGSLNVLGGTVSFGGSNQIPSWTNVTLGEGSTLKLNGTSQKFANLIITGDSVIDFGASSQLIVQTWGNISIADSITITIMNWSGGDVFAGTDPGDSVVNIQYADSSGHIYSTGTWGGGKITPGPIVPESETFGFTFTGIMLSIVLLRRRPRTHEKNN